MQMFLIEAGRYEGEIAGLIVTGGSHAHVRIMNPHISEAKCDVWVAKRYLTPIPGPETKRENTNAR